MYAPRFTITPELLRLVSEASALRTWIAHSVIDVPWLPALQHDTSTRLAHSSTAIEGNPLTLPEVEALARGEDISAETKSKREVLNHLAAMKWIWSRKPGSSIREEDLLRLHTLLMAKTLPEESTGRYKTRPNRVVNGQGHLLYLPPPPDQARRLTLQLLDWISSKESAALHPILVSAIAHHRLVSIHPFSDGNGRASRALGLWILHIRAFDTHHLFALDEFFESDRQRYYDKVQQARDLDDDLTYWLEYVAKGVVDTLKKTQERIASLKLPSKAKKIALTKRQEDVLRFLRDRGRTKSPEIEAAFKITRSRVQQLLKPLVDAGLVTREGQTRATTYRICE